MKEADNRVLAPAQQGTSSQLKCHPTSDHAPGLKPSVASERGSHWMSIAQSPPYTSTHLDFDRERFNVNELSQTQLETDLK